MKKLFNILVVVAVSCGSCFAAHAQSEPQWVSPYYQWTVEKWDKTTDAPFAKQTASLRKASQPQLLNVVSAPLPASPEPLQIYRIGAAGYFLNMKFKNPKGEAAMRQALRAMEQLKPPNSYNFTRLRFLLTARRGRFQELKAVGVKLAQRDPNDYDVRYLLVNLLRPELNAEDKKLALHLLDEMKQIEPDRPSLQSVEGGVYFRLWLKNRDEGNRKLALAKYRRFLQVAPPDNSFRPQAELIIAQLEKG